MLIILAFLVSAVSSDLDTLLKAYQSVHRDDVTIRYFKDNVVVSLTIDNQSYVCTLSPNTEIFHSHFSALAVSANSSTEIANSTHSHYIGKVDHIADSRVVLHIDDGIVTGNIELLHELYYIEPSWRHIPEPHPFHMILYRKSDLLYNFGNQETGKFCGHEDDDRTFFAPKSGGTFDNTSFSYNSRFKRASQRLDTCQVILIADHKFYTEIGRSSAIRTMSFLVTIFERVSRIFEGTSFSANPTPYVGYKMQIKQIIVHATPSIDPTNYNYDKTWTVSALLDAFGYGDVGDEVWSKYCLAHLFTNRDFDRGVLGLAYVASPISNKIGGICSEPYTTGSHRVRMLNIGLSTTVNYGRHLLSSELEIITAHEIGHNWGSSHDPDDNDVCAPDDNFYIMYPSAVDGSQANNRKFSPCSKYSIGSVLKYKSTCFEEATTTVCGNGIKEDGEDCDPGANVTDTCCTAECTFTSGAVCSDVNSLCCDQCQFAGPSKVCFQSDGNLLDIINACVEQIVCSAGSTLCDSVTYQDDDTVCFDEGTCKGGICTNFCASKGLTLCAGSGDKACYWTCSGDDGVCDQVFTKLPDGKPCHNGVCNDGVCLLEPQIQTKLWNILTNLTPSTFLRWMGNNVVLVVVLVSLVFWIPLSLFVRWLDEGHDQVDYNIHTLERNKSKLNTQKSTVSSKSFELKPLDNVCTLTGDRF